MTKKTIFIDTEFIDDGKTIELISIALIDQDDNSLYLISNEFDEQKCDKWLLENVVANLGDEPRYSKVEIKNKIIDFIGDGEVAFWGYFSSYDWVVFCQLFGKMLDLPKTYPYYCNDLKQALKRYDLKTRHIEKDGIHNALSDAIWNKKVYKYIQETENRILIEDFNK